MRFRPWRRCESVIPGARIDWMVDPRYTDLVRLVRGVDRTDSGGPAPRCHDSSSRRFAPCGSAGYDAAIDLQGLLKSAVLARIAVPGRVIGFPSGQLREPLARMFYSPTSPSVLARHVIHKNLTLLQAVGVADVEVAFPLTIPQTDAVDEIEARYGSGRYVADQSRRGVAEQAVAGGPVRRTRRRHPRAPRPAGPGAVGAG